MFESSIPTFKRWLPLQGTRWRVSTWWPSDTRDSMQQSLLRLLALAHEQQLDAAKLVANLADEHRGRYRRRLRRLAGRLAAGMHVVDALEQTPEVLKDEEVLAIRFGTQTGTLPSVYQSLLDASNDERGSTARRQTLIYSILTLAVLGLAISFLLTFIFPVLQTIHEEFGLLETHSFYETFLKIADWVRQRMLILILGVVIVTFLCWSIPSRSFFRRVLAGRFVRGVSQSRSGQIMKLLAIAVEAGRPVPAAISTLARYHFDPNVRRKLLFARNEIEQGADAWKSLVDAGLVSPQESVAITSASSIESRIWVIQKLAERNTDRWSQLQRNRVPFLQPLATFAFAAIVLLVAGAVIGYLAQMIQSLAHIV